MTNFFTFLFLGAKIYLQIGCAYLAHRRNIQQLIIFPLIILGSRLEVVRFRGGYLFTGVFTYHALII